MSHIGRQHDLVTWCLVNSGKQNYVSFLRTTENVALVVNSVPKSWEK